MQIRGSYGRSIALLLLLAGISFLTLAFQSQPNESVENTEKTHFQFAASDSSQVWFALITDHPGSSSSLQEYSGGSVAIPLINPSVTAGKQNTVFAHPFFDLLDQRQFIFQYLYPFHFFF